MFSLASLGEGLGASSFLALLEGNVLDDLVIWFVVEGVASHQKPVLFIFVWSVLGRTPSTTYCRMKRRFA